MPETLLSVKSQSPSIAFYSPDPSGRVTGGFLYNQQLQAQLHAVGWHIDQVEHPGVEHHARLHLVDSLMAVDYMKPREMSHNRDSHKAVFLYHLPPYAGQDVPKQWLETERELLEAGRVVVTGTQCFDLLLSRHGISEVQLKDKVSIFTPGIPDNWQTKSTFSAHPKKLIVLASVIPQKGIATIVDALSELTTLNWQCTIYGETEQNPDFYKQMLTKIEALELAQRIQLAGVVAPTQVNQIMREADLLIHCSEFETYSMVTAEAIATGLPVLSTPVGELQQFQKATNLQYLKTHETAELREQMNKLLTEPASYQALCQPGISAPQTKRWRDTAQQWQRLLLKTAGPETAGPETAGPETYKQTRGFQSVKQSEVLP